MTLLALTGGLADWGWVESVIKRLRHPVEIVSFGVFDIPEEEKHGVVRDLVTEQQPSMLALFDKVSGVFSAYLDEYGDAFDGALICGDRVEMLVAAGLLYTRKVPIHHMFAGDTSGCLDDAYRDAISMLSSHLYAASSQSFGRCRDILRIRGSFSMRSIQQVSFPYDTDDSVYKLLDVRPKEYAIARFHPETSVREPVEKWITNCVRQAIGDGIKLLAFPPNRDDGWRTVIEAWAEAVTRFVVNKPNVFAMDELPVPITRPQYLSLLEGACWIAGNSSSFVLEAPLVGNRKVRLFGNRQRGRSGLDCQDSAPMHERLAFNIKQDRKVKCS